MHAEEFCLTEDQNQIPADIISELEQIRAQYGDVRSTIANELAQNSNAFLSSKIAKKRIARFRKKGASAVFATVVIQDKKDSRFDEAKIAEIRELIKKGTYEFVKEETCLTMLPSYNLGSSLLSKNFENPDEYFKARLVILGHIDVEKPRGVNEAPTVLKSSIRLAIALIAGKASKFGVETYLSPSCKVKIHCGGPSTSDPRKASISLNESELNPDHFFMQSNLNTASPMPQDTGGRHSVVGM